MQVLPAAQTVDPVYPIPPHCPYFATTAPVAVAAALVVVVLAFTEVAVDVAPVVAFVLVVGVEPPEADWPLQTAGPGTV